MKEAKPLKEYTLGDWLIAGFLAVFGLALVAIVVLVLWATIAAV
jgi:hypothetical protein